MTSISLVGAYEEADTDYPAPRWGHPKDRRTDLEQIQAELAAIGDGGIPIFHEDFDGGTSEVAQVVGAMTCLKDLAKGWDFLLIGDSQLLSKDTIGRRGGLHRTIGHPPMSRPGCSVEREVRRALALATKLKGFCADNKAVRPTG
ncbi:hypothetical protein ACQP2T_03095 [Nonomuraea sp. CA-143628]|uniref:hypothetical protein n=1 Tax=Nonomuraea sp. CA-143628 TaxID=3239997 RepID=UPI003D8D49DD